MTPQDARGAATLPAPCPDADRAPTGNVVRPSPLLAALRDRLMAAVQALADADSEDDAAYEALWARHEAAAREYLAARGERREAGPSRRLVERVVKAVHLLQRPTRVAALRDALGVDQRTALRLLETMRVAGLPLRSSADPADHRGTRYWLAP